MGTHIFLGDEDVSQHIRAEEVGKVASQIAAIPVVRQALYRLQLDFRQLPGLVADGRDMGTVIFPHAGLKIFLTASVEARAQRRYKQLIDKGVSVRLDDLSKDLAERDARDIGRATAPLRAAKDAYLLDTSVLTADQAVAQVLDWHRGLDRSA